MFFYYFKIGLHNLRRNPVLTALMVLTLAVGIAASISTLTILRMMSQDPIPQKSERLLVPIIDNSDPSKYIPADRTGSHLLNYRDSVNFLDSHWAANRTAIYTIRRGLQFHPIGNNAATELITVDGIATTNSYFAMFDVPFAFGAAWSAEDEKNRAKVVVINSQTASKLVGPQSPVGKVIQLGSDEYRIVGVVGKWNPVPRYTNVLLNDDEFTGEDQIYIPFQTAIANRIDPFAGFFDCSGTVPEAGFDGWLSTSCTWIQFWFEVESTQKIAQLKSQINEYTAQEQQHGRFQRRAENKLLNVMQWLDYLELVDSSYKISTGLSFAFLALCTVNTIGLLLAKFSSRSTEVGVRRALGASKLDIFSQFLIETLVIGLAGGLLGVVLSYSALWIISQQTKQFMVVAHMDVQMLLIAFVFSVLASVLAGLFPIWRACQITPAIQLKSQ